MKIPTVTGCVECEPVMLHESLRPSSNHHYGVAWVVDPEVKVFKAGEDVTFTTIEVVTGPGGWAIRITQPARVCPCDGPAQVELYREFSDDFVVEIGEEGQAIISSLANEHQDFACYRCMLDQILYGETMFDRSTMQHLDVREVIRIRSQPDEAAVKAFRQMVGLDPSPVRVISEANLIAVSLIDRSPFDPEFQVWRAPESDPNPKGTV